jgi:hypothetical protein
LTRRRWLVRPRVAATTMTMTTVRLGSGATDPPLRAFETSLYSLWEPSTGEMCTGCPFPSQLAGNVNVSSLRFWWSVIRRSRRLGASQFGRRLWGFGARSSPLLLQNAWDQWSRECLEHLCNKQRKHVAWCMDLQTPSVMLLLHIENLKCCSGHRWELMQLKL